MKDITEKLTIKSSQTTSGQQIQYELSGCIIHEGNYITSGHYVFLRKTGNDWYKINDATITYVPQNEAEKLLKNGCIFHFKKEGLQIPRRRLDPKSLESREGAFKSYLNWSMSLVSQAVTSLYYSMSLPFGRINRSFKKDS